MTIYGAVVDEEGNILTPPTVLATTPEHARYPWLLPLGDRVLVVFSDDRDGNEGYELYAKMMTASLEAASNDLRITTHRGTASIRWRRLDPRETLEWCSEMIGRLSSTRSSRAYRA